MSIKHFIQEVEKGLRSPAYFLYASDSYLLKEASTMISMSMPETERAFCFTAFDLDGIDEIPSIEQVIDVLNTIPFMGKRQVVVIENAQELAKKDAETLEDYISNPSPHSVLILLHEGSPKGQFKDIIKRVKAIPLDIRQQDLPLWIKEKARQKGLDLTGDAIEYLIGITGTDAGLISSELEKFILLGKNSIGAKDIKGLISGSGDYDVFDLVDALKRRDTDKVFRIARTLMETLEPYNLIGAINWHYSQMSSREKGKTAYYKNVFELLNDADVQIKTSGRNFPVEYLLIRLLQI